MVSLKMHKNKTKTIVLAAASCGQKTKIKNKIFHIQKQIKQQRPLHF